MHRRTSSRAASLIVAVALWLVAPCGARGAELFVMNATAGPIQEIGGDNSVINLISDFIEADSTTGFGAFSLLEGYNGELAYLGVQRALNMSITEFGTRLTLTIPSTNQTVEIRGIDSQRLAENFEAWVKADGLSQWTDFLREMNAATPLALLSGNPKSTVALMGDSAYRKFGFDDSRSRMGFGEPIERWGDFELRIDAGISTVKTDNFDDGLWSFDPSLTLAGDFGRRIGLSFSLVGQYRNYQGAKLADVGAELALPITLMRPDDGPWFWQVSPFVQAAGGLSVGLAAGGLFVGGGVVNSLGWNQGPLEVSMSNEMAYYGGIPINDIGGYEFNTKLSQLYFKNGFEGTWWWERGFYAAAGVHFTNFAIDAAAVSWFSTPTIGVGWQVGRWVDFRVAYEADLGANEYRSHNAQLKMDLFF